MPLFRHSAALGLSHSREGAGALSLRPRGRGGWHVECLWHLPWRQEGVRGEEERLQAARDWMDQERLSRSGA